MKARHKRDYCVCPLARRQLRPIAYGLPLTRGIMAARLAMEGATWSGIGGLIGGEVLVGAIYVVAGYVCFRLIERRSMSSGMLDAI